MESRRRVHTGIDQTAGIGFDDFFPLASCTRKPRYAWQE